METRAIQEWASAYIDFHEDADRSIEHHPLFWAVTQFMDPGEGASTEDCWTAILEVLARDPSDETLAVLAAGPLEDLIDAAGYEFIDRIELLARRDAAFRRLLNGVWESSTPEIWERVVKAQGRFVGA